MRAAANGIALNYRIDGPSDGPSITFVPGIGNDLAFWEPQAAALADRFRVLRYDPRGHGDSDATGGDYTFDLVQDDVVGLWDALGIRRSHVVGLGFGGSAAIGLAIAHPERVASLVACCCRARMTPEFDANWRARLAVVDSGGMAAIVEPTLERWFAASFRERHPEVIAALRGMLQRTTEAGYRGAVAAFRTLDFEDEIAGIRVPTLFVGGGEDRSGGPREVMAAMTAKVPGARQMVIEGAGHICNLEAPERFNAALAGFLDGQP
jgi:3-oxoadipate enol-lactonase